MVGRENQRLEKDECRHCGASGHLARHCTDALGTVAAGDQNPPPAAHIGGSDPVGGDAFAQDAVSANNESSVQELILS